MFQGTVQLLCHLMMQNNSVIASQSCSPDKPVMLCPVLMQSVMLCPVLLIQPVMLCHVLGDTYSKCKCNACFKQAVMLSCNQDAFSCSVSSFQDSHAVLVFGGTHLITICCFQDMLNDCISQCQDGVFHTDPVFRTC